MNVFFATVQSPKKLHLENLVRPKRMPAHKGCTVRQRRISYSPFNLSMIKKILLLIIGLMFFIPFSVTAYSNPGKPAGFVNDYAGLMSVATRQSLDTELSNFEKETRHEIVVVTVPNLGGDTIENFAVKLFADWQIGKKGADNGVLFFNQ